MCEWEWVWTQRTRVEINFLFPPWRVRQAALPAEPAFVSAQMTEFEWCLRLLECRLVLCAWWAPEVRTEHGLAFFPHLWPAGSSWPYTRSFCEVWLTTLGRTAFFSLFHGGDVFALLPEFPGSWALRTQCWSRWIMGTGAIWWVTQSH